VQYYIHSKESGIVHIVAGIVRGADIRWTLCNQIVTNILAIRSDLPSGYRVCHHCQVVHDRQTDRAALIGE
jgi:hypothetical protein